MAHHLHHHHAALVARDDEVQTVVSIVYVTATPTFDGPVGGYITLTPTADEPIVTATRPTPLTFIPSNVDDNTSASLTTTSTATTPVIPIRSHRPGHKSSTDSLSSSTIDTSTLDVATSSSVDTAAPSSTDARSTSDITPTSTQTTLFVASTVASSSFAASSTSLDSGVVSTPDAASTITEHSSSNGMSGGAKAGTTIGVLLAVGFLFALALFFWRRKKFQHDSHEEIDDFDEKTPRPITRSSMTSRFSLRNSYLKAPRLSLGPLNHIFPVMSEKSSNEHANPFGDHAAPVVNEKNHPMLPQSGPSAAAAVPKPLSIRSDRAGFNNHMSAQSSRQPPQAAPQASNVHRVQLEFKPSMDDELELRPGQLVRMLHEYDDGWALCIRLDRSQQGVVPRTCISKMPLKPRPTGPPGAGPRHGQRNGHRMSPAGSTGSMTSYTSNDSVPPLSPANSRIRSESNASYLGQVRNNENLDGRPRSNSTSTFDAPRAGPMGMSPLNPTSAAPYPNNMHRKPVPGQAI